MEPSRIVLHPTILHIISITITPDNVNLTSTFRQVFLVKTTETHDNKNIITFDNTNYSLLLYKYFLKISTIINSL